MYSKFIQRQIFVLGLLKYKEVEIFITRLTVIKGNKEAGDSFKHYLRDCSVLIVLGIFS